jgi:16S rRNA (uracil1498-N3)-methyltransferase
LEKPFEESWFYAPIPAVGGRAVLSPEESHHLRKVLRVQMGRCVVASNGAGGVFLCGTRDLNDAVELTAVEQRLLETDPPKLNLALGLLKGRDSEEPVEGLCQLAVHAIHLLTTDHTQEFKGQDHGKLVERLRAKSLVALKQAKKPWLTRIEAPVPLRKFREANPDLALVLLQMGEDRLPERFDKGFAVLAGPEGGFSPAEVEWIFREHGYRMGLGGTRIRGTHAPLLACGKLMGKGLIP